MNRRLLIFLLGVLTIFAIGCAVQGQPFEKISSPPGTAMIYVYRPYSYRVVEILPAITCGEDSVRISPGGYHAFIVPAGQKVSCSAQTDSASDEVDIPHRAAVVLHQRRTRMGPKTSSHISIQWTPTRRKPKSRVACRNLRMPRLLRLRRRGAGDNAARRRCHAGPRESSLR